MALISSAKPERIEIPHEPGQWIELRPLRAGDLDVFEASADGGLRVSYELLARVVTSWSYGPWPASEAEREECVKDLDLDTYSWLVGAIGERLPTMSGIRDEAEKKDSTSPSSDITGPGEEAGPEISGT